MKWFHTLSTSNAMFQDWNTTDVPLTLKEERRRKIEEMWKIDEVRKETVSHFVHITPRLLCSMAGIIFQQKQDESFSHLILLAFDLSEE